MTFRNLLVPTALIFLLSCSGTPSTGNGTAITDATVTGSVRYEDKQYDSSGFTNNTSMKPVRHALVEVVDNETFLTIARGTTDRWGDYSITLDHTGNSTVYVRVVASTALSDKQPVRVFNQPFTGSAYLYASASETFTLLSNIQSNIDMDITLSSAAAGAYNILDVMTEAGEFLSSIEGLTPPELNVYWQADNPNGTYFCPDYGFYCSHGPGIYVLAESWYNSDTDGFDDDVLWHEYGHFATEAFSADDSPGGAHALTQNDQDLRLSWSEGWGNFFTGAVKRWHAQDPARTSQLSASSLIESSQYVDNLVSGIYLTFNFNSPGGSPYYYSSSEVAVAKVLTAVESNFGIQPLWDAVSGFSPASISPVNIEMFWNDYLTLHSPGAPEYLTLESVFTERMLNYKLDAYEAQGDDNMNFLRVATLNTPESHTLYKNHTQGDRDHIAFNGEQGYDYTIETYCPTNGADTYLILRDSIGTFITANDDSIKPDPECTINRFSAFSSKIQRSITITNTYFVETVTTTPQNDEAGRYGGYKIIVTRTPTP